MRRRCALVAAVLAAALVPHGAAADEGMGSCDWRMYGADLGHSFAAPCPAIDLVTSQTLHPKWFVPAADSVTASATVAAGMVFVGDWTGAFHAIDAATGTVVWTKALDDGHRTAFGRIVSTAAIERVRVRALGDPVPLVVAAAGATLYALDPRTGEVLASVNVDPRPNPPSPADDQAEVEIESSPAIVDLGPGTDADAILVGMDVHNGRDVGRTGLLSFSLKADDGDLAFDLNWKFDPERGRVLHALTDTDGSPGFGCGGVWSSPAVDVEAGLVFFGTANCEHPGDSAAAGEVGGEAVFAVDARDGHQVWRFRPRGPNRLDDDFGASAQLLPGDMVGIGGKDGRYYALDRATGAQRWATPVGQPGHLTEDFAVGGIIGTPALGLVAGWPALFVTTALSTPIGGPLDSEAASPDATLAEDPGRLFSLHALDAATGEIRWRSAASRQSYGAPVVARGVIFVPSTFDLSLKVVEPETGALLRSIPLPGAPSSAPVIVNDSLYIGVGTRTTDLEFKTFGDDLGSALSSVLGAHPLSPLSGVAAFTR